MYKPKEDTKKRFVRSLSSLSDWLVKVFPRMKSVPKYCVRCLFISDAHISVKDHKAYKETGGHGPVKGTKVMSRN